MAADTHGREAAQGEAFRLLTIADHQKWEAKYSHVLEPLQAERQERIDTGEAERLAVVADAVIRSFQAQRKRGLSINEAGDVVEEQWHSEIGYAVHEMAAVLRELGWKDEQTRSPAERTADILAFRHRKNGGAR
jgi:hypothetical protein